MGEMVLVSPGMMVADVVEIMKFKRDQVGSSLDQVPRSNLGGNGYVHTDLNPISQNTSKC